MNLAFRVAHDDDRVLEVDQVFLLQPGEPDQNPIGFLRGIEPDNDQIGHDFLLSLAAPPIWTQRRDRADCMSG
ncbi:hypothetical protein D9M70_524040 [compost metagenome]